MGESRDAKDPRDTMAAMRKEAQAEFEREETGTTGGQEHASREERAGKAAGPEDAGRAARATREQSEAEALRKPHGDPVTGGGGNAAGGVPAPRDEHD